jgi:hypothetical protein
VKQWTTTACVAPHEGELALARRSLAHGCATPQGLSSHLPGGLFRRIPGYRAVRYFRRARRTTSPALTPSTGVVPEPIEGPVQGIGSRSAGPEPTAPGQRRSFETLAPARLPEAFLPMSSWVTSVRLRAGRPRVTTGTALVKTCFPNPFSRSLSRTAAGRRRAATPRPKRNPVSEQPFGGRGG